MTKKKQPSINILFLALMVAGVVAALLIANFFSQKSHTNEKDQEAEASAESIKQGNEEREKYPLLEKLPIKNSLYTIGYRFEDERLIVTIDTSDTYINAAIKELNSYNSDEKPNSAYDVRVAGLSTENRFKKEEAFKADQSIKDLKTFLNNGYSDLGIDFVVGEVQEITYTPSSSDENNGETSEPNTANTTGDAKTYYATTLTTGSEETYNALNYRILLEKSSDQSEWIIAAGPELYLTTINSPGINAKVLQKANEL